MGTLKLQHHALERHQRTGAHFLSGDRDAVHDSVVVVGFMVEDHRAPYPGGVGHPAPLLPRRVPPADVVRICGIGIHAVVNHDVGITRQFQHGRVKAVGKLSKGFRQRVGMAQALLHEPDVLVLDEPTAGLDPEASDSFCDLLRGLHRELGLTVVMVTHDLDTLFDLSTRIAVLADHKVIVSGSAREVIAYPHPFIHEYFLGGRGQRALEALHDKPSNAAPPTAGAAH